VPSDAQELEQFPNHCGENRDGQDNADDHQDISGIPPKTAGLPVGFELLDDAAEVKQDAHHRNANANAEITGQLVFFEEKPADGDCQHASEDEGDCGFGLEDAQARPKVPDHRHQPQVKGHDDDRRDKTPIQRSHHPFFVDCSRW